MRNINSETRYIISQGSDLMWETLATTKKGSVNAYNDNQGYAYIAKTLPDEYTIHKIILTLKVVESYYPEI